ncbi:MAG: hypothetical protein OXG51_02145, partial [Gammaproteobacteria bacterium]|nr:hypothetical protein [Gammaproteobacteria bacterium]
MAFIFMFVVVIVAVFVVIILVVLVLLVLIVVMLMLFLLESGSKSGGSDVAWDVNVVGVPGEAVDVPSKGSG